MIDTIYKSIPHVLFLGEQGEDGDTCVFVKADQSILSAVTIIGILTLSLQRKASAVRQGRRKRDNRDTTKSYCETSFRGWTLSTSSESLRFTGRSKSPLLEHPRDQRLNKLQKSDNISCL